MSGKSRVQDLYYWNLAAYAAIWALEVAMIWAAGAIGADEVPWFTSPSLHPYKPLALALLGPAAAGLGTWLAANRPKLNQEVVAVQVKHLQQSNIPMDRMIVEVADTTEEAHKLQRHAADATSGRNTEVLVHVVDRRAESGD